MKKSMVTSVITVCIFVIIGWVVLLPQNGEKRKEHSSKTQEVQLTIEKPVQVDIPAVVSKIANNAEDKTLLASKKGDEIYPSKGVQSVITDDENEVSSASLLDVSKSMTEFAQSKMNIDSRKVTLTPEKYDVKNLLNYRGNSTRLDEPIQNGVSMIDFDATDKNVRAIDTLFSSFEIPYNITQTGVSWGEPRLDRKLMLVVPSNRYQEARSIIIAGINSNVFEKRANL